MRICITGHRDLLNPERVRKEIRSALKNFKEKFHPVICISAIASGADTLFAEEALALNIPLEILLPFAAEIYKKDFTGEDLKKLESFLEKHDYQIACDIPATSEERKKAYLYTGKKMAYESDIVMAVWDGKPAVGVGGTGDIVAYARSEGKKVYIIEGLRKDNDR